MGAAGKHPSKREIVIILQRNVRPPPAPLESEDEETALPLTANHHQWLEQAQEALEEKLMADASACTAPYVAASPDPSSDLDVAIAEEPDESAGPDTTIRQTLSGELASRFVASSCIPGSSAASSVTFSYQPPTVATSHVQLSMTREQLNQSYGRGLHLMEALNWVNGSCLGSEKAATSGALKTPLKSDTQLDRLSAKSQFSLDTHVQDNPIIDDAT